MTNQIAIIILICLALAALVDFVFGLGVGLFLARKFFELMEFIAFWR